MEPCPRRGSGCQGGALVQARLSGHTEQLAEEFWSQAVKWTMALVLVSTHKWVLVLCSLGCACTNIGAYPKIQNVQRISEWDGSEHKEEVMPAFSIKVCMFLDAVGTPVLLFQKEGRRSEAREYLALRDLHDERLRAQGVRSWRRLTAQWLMCCGWRTTSVMIVPRDTENKDRSIWDCRCSSTTCCCQKCLHTG